MYLKVVRKSFLVVFLLIGSLALSQEVSEINYDNQPLKDVLTDLEQKTNLIFSFSNEVIFGKRITISKHSLAQKELIQLLASQSELVFETIAENQIIISAPLNTRAICGYLFNRNTNEPLPFATIILPNEGKGLTTDGNGFFQVEVIARQHQILIQYVGYGDKSMQVSDFELGNCNNIYLSPEVQSLSEVVVSGYLISGVDKNIDGSLTVLSEEQSILSGFVEPDVLQTVQQIPGITSINETVSDIQVRGGSADQNLILFDGIKMYNIGHFFGMLSVFNPYITEKTKIYKGGASPEYGDRISGVIDINSMASIPKKTTGGIGINGTHADAFLKSRLGKKVGLVASVRRSYTDIEGLHTPTFNAISEKVFQNTKIVSDQIGQVIENDDETSEIEGQEKFFFYDANVKLIFQPSETDYLYVSGLSTNNDLNFNAVDEENVSQDILVVENRGLSFCISA